MPNRWPIASGNWSNTATWNSGATLGLPTASDDVYLNNLVVTLDQTITAASIRDSAIPGVITAGGRMEIYGDYNITVTNRFFLGSAAVTNGSIQYFNSGSITITGNFPLITGAAATSARSIGNVGSGTINFIGNMFGYNASNTSWCLGNISSGTVNIIGNVTAGQNSAAYGAYNSSTGTITITGNVDGGITSFNRDAIYNAGPGTIIVTGNVTGASTTPAYGINNVSIGTVTITGNVTASGSAGINSTTAGTINVIGQLQASTTANAVQSTSTTATNIFSGPLINSGSRNAIYCYNVKLYDDVTTRYTIGVSGSNDTITLFSPDQVTGVPSGSDVRFGTIYGPGNELTGSMYVPHPNSVSIGVAVDNTTGSTIVKPEDLWNYALTTMTASNSIGQRLANTSTSASNAAIVNSFSS
jgi:hypothetical protein